MILCSSYSSYSQQNQQIDLSEMINRVVKQEAQLATFTIKYKEIKGLKGSFQWHLNDTSWWVKLHPDRYSLEGLDKDKTYQVRGVMLEMNYGLIDVWVYEIEKK